MTGNKLSLKKVILFNPMPRGYAGEERNFLIPPISLLAVASGLKDLPYEIIIVDEVVEPDYSLRLKPIIKDVLCVGITSMTGHQISRALKFAEFVRRENNKVKIVWGGYHSSSLPEQTVCDDRVDIVVVGQGQRTFRELLAALDNNTDLRDIKGIVYKENGKVVNTGEREIVKMNDLPVLPYHLIDIEKYIYTPPGTEDRVFGYITSQGCPYNCAFCAELKVTKRSWSGLDPIRIIDEWESFNKKYNISHITLYDSDFCVDLKRVKILVGEIIKRNLNISIGFINVRADQIKKMDDELLSMLKKINCTTFLIGAESGSDKILESINKNCTVQDTIDAKKKLSRYGFTPLFSFMFGLSFDKTLGISPDEELHLILNVIDELRRIDDNNMINIWNYIPYPGAPLTKKVIEAGLKMPSSLEGWADYHLSAIQVPGIDRKYEKWLEMLRNMVFIYVSRNFRVDWFRNYKGRAKWLRGMIHRIYRMISLLRLKYRFFRFPLDYCLFRMWQRKKIMSQGQHNV